MHRASALCFLCFLVRSVLFTPFAKFLQLDFTLYFADVFARPIVEAFALGTPEAD